MKRADRLWLFGLAALVVWVLRSPLFEGTVLYKRDIHLLFLAQMETFVRAVAAGSWPLWDPGLAGGQPLFANPEAQIAYPLTWLNLALRPWTYYLLYAASHLLLGGAGLYCLARRWSMSRPAAFVAAGLFLLSGPFLSLIDVWHHLASASWMPWVLLAADVALEAPGMRGILLWGLAMAVQILGGSADMSAMTGVAAGGLALQRVRWRDPFGDTNRALAVMCLGSLALAAALTAGLWLPALDLASRSARWHLPDVIRTYWSLHPLSVIDTLIPVPWLALPLKPELSSAMFEGREPFLASLYLGAPSLALVGAGLLLSSARHTRPVAVFGAALLLLALGRHAPFYGFMSELLPPLRILRYPVKAMVMVAACWALIAGFGFDAWRAHASAERRRFLAATAGPCAVLALAAAGAAWLSCCAAASWGPLILAELPGAEAARQLAWRFALTATLALLAAALALGTRPGRGAFRSGTAVGLLALADLAALHRNIEPVAPIDLYTHHPEVLRSLGDGEHPRVYTYDYTTASPRYGRRDELRTLARAPAGWDLGAAAALAMQASLSPTTAGRWGLDSGFEIDYRGLFPRNLAQLSILLRNVEGTAQHIRLLQVGGVTHVVALHQEGLEGLVPRATVPGFYEAPVRVFRVPDPLPRTYVVAGARVADGREALGLLLDARFDPRREVLLPDGPSRPAGISPGASRILERRPDRVVIEADLHEQGYVVLLDSYDPGWQARVDGRPSRLLPANLAFRAVSVEAGRHRVELSYRPRLLMLGLAVSVLAAAGAVALAMKALR